MSGCLAERFRMRALRVSVSGFRVEELRRLWVLGFRASVKS